MTLTSAALIDESITFGLADLERETGISRSQLVYMRRHPHHKEAMQGDRQCPNPPHYLRCFSRKRFWEVVSYVKQEYEGTDEEIQGPAYTLPEFAKQQGTHYNTAVWWVNSGFLQTVKIRHGKRRTRKRVLTMEALRPYYWRYNKGARYKGKANGISQRKCLLEAEYRWPESRDAIAARSDIRP